MAGEDADADSDHQVDEYCASLCSAQAGYVTGRNRLIDGGNYPGIF